MITDFDFFPLTFDENGKLGNPAQFTALNTRAATATDVIFLAHGFRNNENDATTLYAGILKTFKENLARPEFHGAGNRNIIVAGVYWPSKPFQETFSSSDASGDGSVQAADDELQEMVAVLQQLESMKNMSPEHSAELDQAIALLPEVKNDPDTQDEFVGLVLSILNDTELDVTEGLQQIRAQQGSDLLGKLSTPVILPTVQSDSDQDEGGTLAVGSFIPSTGNGAALSVGSFFGSIFGKIGQFLNLTTWYIMKSRSGSVGATGVAKAVRDLKATHPAIKIHLVGHSLGGRLMAGCAKSLAQPPVLQPASLTLLEAAFSHYGFSANNGAGTPGFFRDVIDKKVVKGPMISTFSFQDTVVGHVYAIASRLADDNVKAIGDANDPFGGIGRNGAQKTVESAAVKLKTAAAPGAPYTFTPGVVTCLDGSGGLIKEHGDVANSDVTYALASAVAMT